MMSDATHQPAENGARRLWIMERDIEDLKIEYAKMSAKVDFLVKAEDDRRGRETVESDARAKRQKTQDRERMVVGTILVTILGTLVADQMGRALTSNQLALNLSNPLILLAVIGAAIVAVYAARRIL